jgi:hypothetical protein
MLPAWAKTETNLCLASIAEDVYTARALAIDIYHADRYPSCAELLRAAQKSVAIMADTHADTKKRCWAGERAARKFWEAKVCAQRCASRKRG